MEDQYNGQVHYVDHFKGPRIGKFYAPESSSVSFESIDTMCNEGNDDSVFAKIVGIGYYRIMLRDLEEESDDF